MDVQFFSERRILMIRKRVVVNGGGLLHNFSSVNKAARGYLSTNTKDYSSLKKVKVLVLTNVNY